MHIEFAYFEEKYTLDTIFLKYIYHPGSTVQHALI